MPLKHLFKFFSAEKKANSISANFDKIKEAAKTDPKILLKNFESSLRGLSNKKARNLLFRFGKNILAREKKLPPLLKLLFEFKDPLTLLLLTLALIAYFTGDLKATVVILTMVFLSIFLRFFQELKADKAAEKLKALIHTKIVVVRDGQKKEIPIETLVPGDIIHLSAGDMVPADVRLIESKDLYINQSSLTGESLPIEKNADVLCNSEPLDCENVCFLGTNIESGSAVALVVTTGKNTYLGNIAEKLVFKEPLSNFELGISKFTWLIMKIIFVMVPAVFLLNGFAHRDWLSALLFALAVAIGLAPEMLPMIVTVNLTKGATDMSRKKVIVKHLNSIQNFGAMDILCTDKTGTLTEGRVVLQKHLDINGEDSTRVLQMAYLNSYFQTGLNNIMDTAVIDHAEKNKLSDLKKEYVKIDEMPFDFERRRMSVVVKNKDGKHLLICKGATEEIFKLCGKAEINGKIVDFKKEPHHEKIKYDLNVDGFRVIAIAYKELADNRNDYNKNDEKEMTLLGFLAFLDPPKKSASDALAALKQNGISIKILTGDNELVAQKICREVGMNADNIMLGQDLEKLSEKELLKKIETTEIFAKLAPHHKEKIIQLLRQNDHVVGFLGDGINDAPALRAADIGISVDSAADIAKESSDIILLEQSLMVLKDGVIDGRKIFGNVVKYIEMFASSSFGNMFSVVGASFLLPFLPMLPIQIIVNNLLYDLSQSTIPTDNVDPEYLTKPRRWKVDHLKKTIFWLGPVSSIFDFATFFIMLFVFAGFANPELFRTGWFVESLVTQTLIIHILRTNKIPFLQSRASWPVTLSTTLAVAFGIYLTFSPIAYVFGFVALPLKYWIILTGLVIAYLFMTQFVKNYLVRKYRLN